jgi:hypothetical protein
MRIAGDIVMYGQLKEFAKETRRELKQVIIHLSLLYITHNNKCFWGNNG